VHPLKALVRSVDAQPVTHLTVIRVTLAHVTVAVCCSGMALAALNTAAVLELEGRALESEQRYIQVLDAINAEVYHHCHIFYTHNSITCTKRCFL
jgi:hypothetical protein